MSTLRSHAAMLWRFSRSSSLSTAKLTPPVGVVCWWDVRRGLRTCDALGLEALQRPAAGNERPLDRRVPLECGNGIVEQLGARTDRVARWRDAELVRRVVAGQAQLAD